MPDITITSFGYGHGVPPDAEITLDMRPFRDPHFNPALRELTAQDDAIRGVVLATPGVLSPITAAAAAVDAYAIGSGGTDRSIRVAVGCVGGRHRSAAVAEELSHQLGGRGYGVRIEHRDIDKPVIRR